MNRGLHRAVWQSGAGGTLPRRDFIKGILTAGSLTVLAPRRCRAAAGADDVPFDPERKIIAAPADPAQWPEFRRRLDEWRKAKRRAMNYTGSLYRRSDLAWTSSCFSCCFLMMCDETFYDWRMGRYRVKAFLEHGRREFGGYDAVVLWHAYPRIGLDDRNQFDFYRDLPGGLKGVRAVVDELHGEGIKVFIDYNPWDTGTRREGRSDVDMLCEFVGKLDADGIFLDTMKQGAAEFRAKLDAVRPGVALEGEAALPLERVHDHHLSWAQWFRDGEVPGVLRNKWFERRHLQHQIKRWDYDHTGELHTAWMNGSGMLVWENVFGSWMGWSPRDCSILRAMLPIQRRYAPMFCGERWTPLVPAEPTGVYASLWESDSPRLWTLINRSNQTVEGSLSDVNLGPGELLFDLIAGREVNSPIVRLAPRGIGCLLAGKRAALGADFDRFLKNQAALNGRADHDARSPALTTRLREVPRTGKRPRAPEGMAEIPSAKLETTTEIRVRECGYYESTPPPAHRFTGSHQFRLHRVLRRVTLKRFAMDRTPVTNAQFAEFLQATRYRPDHPEGFLQHWVRGAPPRGREDHPVVFVDLDDARAYADWAGKRLPTEEEWQYAAQGLDGRRYPWGNELLPGRCNGGETGSTTPVKAFPDGRSPFGIYDLCGNVWEWAESERSDGRTRFAILKGGSFYTAQGSGWYMNGGPRPASFAAKMLLMWPGLDRCATIGFRCVVDLE